MSKVSEHKILALAIWREERIENATNKENITSNTCIYIYIDYEIIKIMKDQVVVSSRHLRYNIINVLMSNKE